MAMMQWFVAAAVLGSGSGIDIATSALGSGSRIDTCKDDDDLEAAAPSYYPEKVVFETGDDVDGAFNDGECVLAMDPLDVSGVMVGVKWWVGKDLEKMTLKLLKKEKEKGEYKVVAELGTFEAPQTHMNWAVVAHLRQDKDWKISKAQEIVKGEHYLAWCGKNGVMDYNTVTKKKSAVIEIKSQTGNVPQIYKTKEEVKRKYIFQIEYLKQGEAHCERFAKGLDSSNWPTATDISDINKKEAGENGLCFLEEYKKKLYNKCIRNSRKDGATIREKYLAALTRDQASGLWGGGALIIPYDEITIEGILENVEFLQYLAKEATKAEYAFVTTKKTVNDGLNEFEIVSVTDGSRANLNQEDTKDDDLLSLETVEPAENLHIEPGMYFGWWRKGTALMRAEVGDKDDKSRPKVFITTMPDKPTVGHTELDFSDSDDKLSKYRISYYYKLKIYRYNRDKWTSNWYSNGIWSRCGEKNNDDCSDEAEQ